MPHIQVSSHCTSKVAPETTGADKVAMVVHKGLLSCSKNKKVLEDSYNGVALPKAPPPVLHDLNFTINGAPHKVHDPDLNTSLNEYIRAQPGLKGTKVMCKEAGCGCCVVAVTRKDPKTGVPVTKAVNSCTCLLHSVDGCEIRTTEGIGNSKDGFHEIQKRIAEHNGSQCGYCTPGMVMSMYSFLKENPEPSKEKIEAIFDGNICRCTGYRPILDAMKSFADKPIDIEELNRCSGKCAGCPSKGRGHVSCNESGRTWYTARHLADLYAILDHHANDHVRMVAGNTGKGIYKKEGPYNVFIDVNDVPELHTTVDLEDYLVVGGSVCLTDFMKLCDNRTTVSPVFHTIGEHLRVIANTPVRNVGTIAGNLMLAHAHADFPSDIMTMMEGIDATVIIGQSSRSGKSCKLSKHFSHNSGGGILAEMSMQEFVNCDMKGKVFVALAIPKLSHDNVVRSYKITPRAQNAHAYVNGCMVMSVNRDSMTVTSKPRIVFAGIKHRCLHASKTEVFLLNRTLTNPETLKGALDLLDMEVVPDPAFIAHNGSTIQYHKSLTQSLFYKFYVAALGDQAPPRIRSAASKILHERPVSHAEQSFDTRPDQYPLTEPMTKIAATLQASGEAEYVNDIPAREGEVYAAFVISTAGNCKIDITKFDTSDAMKMPGAIAFISAQDIPGENNFNFFNWAKEPIEGVFCNGNVLYPGQLLGLMVADTQRHADEAAEAVKVSYTDHKPMIRTIPDAIKAKHFAPPNELYSFLYRDVTTGDPKCAIKEANHVISGEVQCGGQHQFHLETQVALCVPEEKGMTVYCSCQGPDVVQCQVSRVTGVPAKDIDVITRRCGGSFGAKAMRAAQNACACAVAALVLKRPVRLNMNFNTNMTLGGRSPNLAKYKVAFDDNGILQAVDLDYYSDSGCTPEDIDLFGSMGHWDNTYFCPNWEVKNTACMTNKACTTWCRAPGMMQAVFIMESIIEHVGSELGLTQEEVRQRNLYSEGQNSPLDRTLPNCTIQHVWSELMQSSEFARRKAAVEEFNKANRWRKRGIAVTPGKYWLEPQLLVTYLAQVAIYHHDGSVAVTHGGVEMGQGINVKVAQVVAHTLGIPIEKVTIKQHNTQCSPNSHISGGSTTSDLCAKGAYECCKILLERLAPVKEQLQGAPWEQIIQMAIMMKINLTAQYLTYGNEGEEYATYGVTCAEAEVDILTGERQILRCDILQDCGTSYSPQIDIGQVEGAFMFGLGYWLCEKLYYDEQTGMELSNGTWTYKPPTTKDIPVDLRVGLLKNSSNPVGFLGSKASGEPPAVMSCVVLFAVKHAIEAARKEIGKTQHFTLNGPATVEQTQLHCLVNKDQMTLADSQMQQ